MKNFAVLASGKGSNLQAILSAVKEKKIKANLNVVVSDNRDAFALKRAIKEKIATVVVDPKSFKSRKDMDKAIVKELKSFGIDFVILAGYMRILSPYFVKAYKNRILNIHPALLPSFKGAHAIRDAFRYGVRITGVTVHLVDEKVDHGFVIAQESVQIRDKETFKSLEARIHKVEHKLYPEVISRFAKGCF